ncbi:hypothetical protein U1839_25845 [Sphingomonas sp. RT2P30]|uniref:hypothetical protein n=1 Tax=Parasphingomonas halimpatiens TaxID=3096162 RepID=UPI002FCABADB
MKVIAAKASSTMMTMFVGLPSDMPVIFPGSIRSVNDLCRERRFVASGMLGARRRV